MLTQVQQSLRNWTTRVRKLLGSTGRVGIKGHIRVRRYDTDRLCQVCPAYPDLARPHRLRVQEVAPSALKSVTVDSNTVTQAWLDNQVDVLDPNQSTTGLEATHIAVGTQGTSPSTSDTALGNEVERIAVAGSTDNGNDITLTTTFSTSEANTGTLREAGLFTASTGGTMLDRALITPIDKKSGEELTVDGILVIDAL